MADQARLSGGPEAAPSRAVKRWVKGTDKGWPAKTPQAVQRTRWPSSESLVLDWMTKTGSSRAAPRVERPPDSKTAGGLGRKSGASTKAG